MKSDYIDKLKQILQMKYLPLFIGNIIRLQHTDSQILSAVRLPDASLDDLLSRPLFQLAKPLDVLLNIGMHPCPDPLRRHAEAGAFVKLYHQQTFSL